MKIKGVYERIIDSDINITKFYLVNGVMNDSDLSILEVLPIEDNTLNMDIEDDNLFLTDIYGNVLLDQVDSFHNYTIVYSSGNDILISKNKIEFRKKGTSNKIEELSHYSYNDIDRHLMLKHKFNSLNKKISVSLVSSVNDILLFEEKEGKKNSASLYSVKLNEFITPSFNELVKVDDDIYRFKDIIDSNNLYKGNKESGIIVGFISSDGKFYNQIYDYVIHDIKEVELNNHQNFMQYKALKRYISHELDEKIEQLESQDIIDDKKIKYLKINAKK